MIRIRIGSNWKISQRINSVELENWFRLLYGKLHKSKDKRLQLLFVIILFIISQSVQPICRPQKTGYVVFHALFFY